MTADTVQIDTSGTESVGTKISNLKSEATQLGGSFTNAYTALTSVECGESITPALLALSQSWNQGITLIGGELDQIGGRVNNAAQIYRAVETNIMHIFTALPSGPGPLLPPPPRPATASPYI